MSIQRKMFTCLSTPILVAAAGATTAESVAETYTVSPTGSINSISKTIALSNDGDTIKVENGVYTEWIVIDKSIKLKGIDRPSFDGQGKGTTIRKREVGLLKRVENSQPIFHNQTGLYQKNWHLSEWSVGHEGK